MNGGFLISPHISTFTPEDYRTHVQDMYELPQAKRSAKPPSAAPGLSVGRTKAGALSVRRTKSRAFAYVTLSEIAALATAAGCSQADLWQAFKAKKYIVATSRMEAERAYAAAKEIPWK